MHTYNVTIMSGERFGLNLIVEAATPGEAKAQARQQWEENGVAVGSATLTAKKIDTGDMPSAIRRFL